MISLFLHFPPNVDIKTLRVKFVVNRIMSMLKSVYTSIVHKSGDGHDRGNRHG